MKIEKLYIGQKIKHPQHGLGTVKEITQSTVQIQFDDCLRTISPETSEIQPSEPTAALDGLEMPLDQLIKQILESTIEALGLEKDDAILDIMGKKWHGGRMVLHPFDAQLQPKEIPIDTFFSKIVMVRNNLRVLEQKINNHDGLTSADKFDIQQYISRCYGSLTTFNVLFNEKEDQFRSKL